MALKRVLQKVIAAKGCVVPDEFLRSGRRERRSDGKGELVGRMRAHQRIQNMVSRPLHPDAEEALNNIQNGIDGIDPDLEAEAAMAAEVEEDAEREADEGPDESDVEEDEDDVDNHAGESENPILAQIDQLVQYENEELS